MQQFGPMSYAGGCSITYPVAVSRLLLLVIRGGGLFSVQFYAKFSFFHMDSCHKSNFRAGKNADFASIAKYQTPHFWYHASVDAKSAFLGCTNMTCDKNTPEKVQILRRGTQTGVDSNEDADYVVGGGEDGMDATYFTASPCGRELLLVSNTFSVVFRVMKCTVDDDVGRI